MLILGMLGSIIISVTVVIAVGVATALAVLMAACIRDGIEEEKMQ